MDAKQSWKVYHKKSKKGCLKIDIFESSSYAAL